MVEGPDLARWQCYFQYHCHSPQVQTLSPLTVCASNIFLTALSLGL